MKSVILIRHVKSDWSNLIPDFDRPVREDRKVDAVLIAQDIAGKGSIPECVISSPAIRALQTAKLICTKWDYPYEDIAIYKLLYECAAKDILTVISRTDEKYHSIAIVCHNPAITDFVNQYSDTFLLNVPTSGAVEIGYEVSHWKDIKSNGKASWVLRPKEMKVVNIKAGGI